MPSESAASGPAQAPPQTAGDMLARAREFLARKGAVESRLDAELLVARAVGLDRLKLFLQLDRPVSEEEVARARELLVRRGKHEPVAYLTGTREFYGRPFRVGPGVLVPRPETELIVDLARERAGTAARRPRFRATEQAADEATPSRPALPPRVLDVGTGSGCLAITLALELEDASIIAIDLSAAALAWARENAAALAPDAGLEFQEGDALRLLRDRTLRPDPALRFDLVVSNPPYVRAEDAETLPPDVREHEPGEALFAPRGDEDYWVRELLTLAPRLLAPGGTLLVELGLGQAKRCAKLATAAGFEPRLHEDAAGIPRVLEVNAAR